MSINILTVKGKRTAIRRYYERKYENLVNEAFLSYYDQCKKGDCPSKEHVKTKVKFLNREKNRLLDELDEASSEKVKKLFAEMLEQKEQKKRARKISKKRD